MCTIKWQVIYLTLSPSSCVSFFFTPFYGVPDSFVWDFQLSSRYYFVELTMLLCQVNLDEILMPSAYKVSTSFFFLPFAAQGCETSRGEFFLWFFFLIVLAVPATINMATVYSSQGRDASKRLVSRLDNSIRKVKYACVRLLLTLRTLVICFGDFFFSALISVWGFMCRMWIHSCLVWFSWLQKNKLL